MDLSPNPDPTLVALRAGELQGTTRLKLCCGLTTFPTEIFTLADSLEILDLTGNQLTSLPPDLGRLTKLRIIFCSQNQFSHLPAVLGDCPNLSMIGFKANQIKHIDEAAIPTTHLRWLILTDNALTQLPKSLGNCPQLQKLMLAGNQLSALPESLVNCQALELLRISANRFSALPAWLFELPQLTWLAYAGNPFSAPMVREQMRQHRLPQIDWQALTLQQVLGEGASGVTYQALWQQAHTKQTVAVKLFKSGVTSDGLPRCEIEANTIAGSHPNLVGIEGVISKHPQGVQGMVMPLLDSALRLLAQPPSFDSCTRDVYPQAFRLSTMQAQHIAQHVSNALNHLHARGLMHGDLYAHNILWGQQQVMLSDLGGASFLPTAQPALAEKLEQLDWRAYQILLAELIKCTGLGTSGSEDYLSDEPAIKQPSAQRL